MRRRSISRPTRRRARFRRVPCPPLRIAFFAQDFPPEVGGTQLYNPELASRLARAGTAARLHLGGERGEAEATRRTRSPCTASRAARAPRRSTRAASPRGSRAPRPTSRSCRAARARSPAWCRSRGGSPPHGGLGARPGAPHAARSLGRWRVRRAMVRPRGAAREQRAHAPALAAARPRADGPRLPGRRHRSVSRPIAAAASRRARSSALGRRRAAHRLAAAANKGHLRVIEALPALRRASRSSSTSWSGRAACAARSSGSRPRWAWGTRSLQGPGPRRAPLYHACDVFVMASTPSAAARQGGRGLRDRLRRSGRLRRAGRRLASGGGAEIVIDGYTGCVVDPADPRALERAIA